MKVTVNGAAQEIAGSTLAAALQELGFRGGVVATAVNDDFVPVTRRAAYGLTPGDRIEVLAPMQGG